MCIVMTDMRVANYSKFIFHPRRHIFNRGISAIHSRRRARLPIGLEIREVGYQLCPESRFVGLG